MNISTLGLSPKIAISMFRKALEHSLKKPVSDYKLIYRSDNNTLNFQLPEGLVPYKNASVMYLIKTLCETKITEGSALDMVILNYENNGALIYLTIFYSKNNVKQSPIKHIIE